MVLIAALRNLPDPRYEEPQHGQGVWAPSIRFQLHTQSEWGWHRFPNPEGFVLGDALRPHPVHGREVLYASEQDGPAGQWLRENPHRLDLGRIGLVLKLADGSDAAPVDLQAATQTLDLWSGILRSEFR